MKVRIGQGIDFHRLEYGRKLWLGGINVPSDKGCIAHSDGDALIHALCDALLGAAGLNDIGFHFPDTSDDYKDIDSKILLEKTFSMIREKGYVIGNADCTICLEKPKIAAFIPDMRKTIAEILMTKTENITIKATTTEKMGFAGREEGLAAMAVVIISEE